MDTQDTYIACKNNNDKLNTEQWRPDTSRYANTAEQVSRNSDIHPQDFMDQPSLFPLLCTNDACYPDILVPSLILEGILPYYDEHQDPCPGWPSSVDLSLITHPIAEKPIASVHDSEIQSYKQPHGPLASSLSSSSFSLSTHPSSLQSSIPPDQNLDTHTAIFNGVRDTEAMSASVVDRAVTCNTSSSGVSNNDNQASQESLTGIRKRSHSSSTKNSAQYTIERQYRNNMNDRMAELRDAVPALQCAKASRLTSRQLPRNNDDAEEEECGDGVALATKLNILRNASEYICHLQKAREPIQHENHLLQKLLEQLPQGAELLNMYRKEKLEHFVRRMREECRTDKERRWQQQERSKRRRKASSHSDSTTRTFLAMFMCLSFFALSPSSKDSVTHLNEQDISAQDHGCTHVEDHNFSLTDGWQVAT